MTGSRLHLVLDALADLFDEVLPDTWLVVDGATPDDSAATVHTVLVVGADGIDNEEQTQAGEAQQSWAALGRSAREENGSVQCTLVHQVEQDVVRAARTGAFEGLALVEQALVSSIATTVSGAWLGVPGLLYGGITSVQLRDQVLSGRGAEVALVFTINYKARIN